MIEVLYEDNHLIAVNKPAGLLTQPTPQEQHSLEVLVKAWIKETYQKAGNVFLGVLHRLDKPVSGIVLFAKTSKALSRLNASLRSKDWHKTYSALVEGQLPSASGTLEHFLRHDDHQAYLSNAKDPSAKLARLHYQVVKNTPRGTWVEIKLETGRYHQIRAQLSAIGCPIVGDRKYGSKQSLPNHVIALHHTRLELIHPVTQEPLSIEASIPPEWGLG